VTLAKQIDDLAAGYLPAMALFAAVELGVFDALDETPCSFSELASRIDASLDGTTRLCRALAALGLLELEGETVRAVPEAKQHLTGDAVAMLKLHRRHLLHPLMRLPQAVRTGQSQHSAWPFASIPAAANPYDELARHPAELKTLALAMDHASAGVGTAIARSIDLSQARLLVDLGGGAGVVARELLAALPQLHIHSFDHEVACGIARERSIAAGLGERHVLEVGDVRDGVPVHHADAVLLSAVLADFPVTERLAILRRARATLRTGGMVLVSETLLDEGRTSPPRAALLSLVMLAAARGDQLSGAQLAAELVAAGFVRPRIHRDTSRDLVIAFHE
jgi:phospholipid N-methyltransferase